MQKQNKQVEKVNTQPNQPNKFDLIQSQYKFIIRQVLYEKLYNQTEQFHVYVNEILQDRSDETQIKAQYQQGQESTNLNSSATLGQQNGQNGLMQALTSKILEQSDKSALKQRKKKKKIYQQKDFFLNQDKALNLAQKMMRMKQQRQKKHQITRQNIKIFLEKQRQQNQLKKLQALAMTPQNLNLFKRTSLQIKKGNNSQLGSYYDHRYKVQNQLAFSRTRHNQSMNSHQKNLRNYNIKKVPNMFADLNSLRSQYTSLTLTPRQLNNSMIQKRNMQREVQILRKSKKISMKYEVKKFLIQILIDIANKCVDLVQKKKQFYHYSPPLKIHQIIDKNNPAYKKYRKKLQKRRKRLAKKQRQDLSKIKSSIIEQKQEENINKRTKTSRISQVFSLNIKGKEQQQSQRIQDSQSQQNSSSNSSQESSQNQQSSSQNSDQNQNDEKQSQSSEQSSLQCFQEKPMVIESNKKKSLKQQNFVVSKTIQTEQVKTQTITSQKGYKKQQEINKLSQKRSKSKQQQLEKKAQIQLIDRRNNNKNQKAQKQTKFHQQENDIQRRNIGTKQFKRTKMSSLSINKTQNQEYAKRKNIEKSTQHKIRINSEVRITQKTQIQQLQLQNSQKSQQNQQIIKSPNQNYQQSQKQQNPELNVKLIQNERQSQKKGPDKQQIENKQKKDQNNIIEISETQKIKNETKSQTKIENKKNVNKKKQQKKQKFTNIELKTKEKLNRKLK